MVNDVNLVTESLVVVAMENIAVVEIVNAVEVAMESVVVAEAYKVLLELRTKTSPVSGQNACLV